ETLESDVEVVEDGDHESEPHGERHEEETRDARFTAPDLSECSDHVEEKERRETDGERHRHDTVPQEIRKEERVRAEREAALHELVHRDGVERAEDDRAVQQPVESG